MYKIKLESDNEILNSATIVYQFNNLTDDKLSLESLIFGANTTISDVCSICGQRLDKCIGHYAVVELPLPIVRTICHDHCISLLKCLCPVCSKIILTDEELEKIKKLDPEFRLKTIVEYVKKFISKQTISEFVCPHCNNTISSTIDMENNCEPFVDIFTLVNPATASREIISPIFIYQILQNFTQIDEIGFSESYHPKNFMTSYIPILPTKLRTKSIVDGTETTSCLTTYYTYIVKLVSMLNSIKNDSTDKGIIYIDESKLNTFIENYTNLYAYYLLITNSGSEKINNALLGRLNKSFRTGYDSNSCLIKRFKGKNKSIFNKGMIGTVHDCACRVVLGAAEDLPSDNMGVPYSVANKLSIGYPVYKENLKFCKSLLVAMTNNKIYSNPYIPKVLGIFPLNTKKFQKFNISIGIGMANKLQEGDVICLSLCNKDFIVQSRHPVIREECLTSFQIKKQDSSTLSLPLIVCPIKQADFDGDEIQGYLSSDHSLDIEALLLHSAESQLGSAGSGEFSFFYEGSHDTALGVSRLSRKENQYLNYHNHKSQKDQLINIYDEIEKLYPKDFNYRSSSMVIKDGKIDRNHLNNFKDKRYLRYFATRYGPVKALQLMDLQASLGYEINRNYGASLGFEIKVFGGENARKQIDDLKNSAIEKSTNLLKINGKPNSESINCFEEIKPKIKMILLENAKGTNLDNMEYTKNRAGEYQAMVAFPNHVLIDGLPVSNFLAEGTRTNFGGYKYSIDPRDYGFVDRGYTEDISAYAHFFIMMEELKGIFKRTTGVAEQGYMTKKMTIFFQRAFADYNGSVVDNEIHLANQYGQCGFNSKIEIILKLEDLELSCDEFNKIYDDKKLQEVHKYLLDLRNKYKSLTIFKRQAVENGFLTALDYNQLFLEKDLGKSNQKDIDEFIDEMYEIFVPKSLQNDKSKIIENFKHHEYFFRQKFSKYKINKKLKSIILNNLRNVLIDAGDPIGSKCALSASAPMTQAMLSAIHASTGGGISVEAVRRPQGVNAFEQLIAGKIAKDTLYMTIVLNDDSKEATEKFASDNETFYYNEIWAMHELHISKKIPEFLINSYGNKILEAKLSPLYVIGIWNMVKISGFNIKTTEIINALMKNYQEIACILPIVINKTQIKVFIYFHENVTSQRINKLIKKWSKNKDSNIIHGKYLKNCFVVENINNPGHYSVDANEAIPGSNVFDNVILLPEINPCKCLISHPEHMLRNYGIFESEPRFFEQVVYSGINLSETRELSGRVWKLIANIMTADGFFVYANALSMLNGRFGDLMKQLRFERADLFLRDACIRNKKQFINEFTSASVFGEKPPIGDTVSKYMIYSNNEN